MTGCRKRDADFVESYSGPRFFWWVALQTEKLGNQDSLHCDHDRSADVCEKGSFESWTLLETGSGRLKRSECPSKARNQYTYRNGRDYSSAVQSK